MTNIFNSKGIAVLRSVTFVSIITLLSKITGMFQTRIVASCLGAGIAADAFMVAFRIPNLLRRFTAEGTMSSALMLTFNEIKKREGETASRKMIARFIGTFILLLALLNIIVIPVMGIFTGLQMLGRLGTNVSFLSQLRIFLQILSGVKAIPIQWHLTNTLAKIMFPYLLLTSVTASFSVALNLSNKFCLPVLSSVLWNVVFIFLSSICLTTIPAIWQSPEYLALWLAIIVIIGGLFQLILLLPAFYKNNFKVHIGCFLYDHGVRAVFRRMVPGILGNGIYPINVMISTMLASQLGIGAQTILFNSNMMCEMILGVFAVSFSTVSLPIMSQLVVNNDFQGLNDRLVETMKHMSIFIIPSAVGLAILSHPIIDTILQSGLYNTQATYWTANTLIYQLSGLLFIAFSRLLIQCLYAMDDYKRPVYLSLLVMIINILFSLILMNIMGTAGIAVANCLASLIGLLLLIMIVNNYVQNIPWMVIFRHCLLIFIASGIMGYCAKIGENILYLKEFTSVFDISIKLFPLIIVCVVIYFTLLFIFKIPELIFIRHILVRTIKKN